ncbi:hypothetical protein LRP67_06490 [Nocardioides sp. cx-169]|uniref:hypothetical protein n=1 Tax=Nocardioides sp. cx-169 TaxID=2899080 RepID=UPI001E60970A|nr:hypothetical protein [Nocardioides sp. cx-169]MCD4533725.1 hypothetical protein [Nocardioides sp. cx-169]
MAAKRAGSPAAIDKIEYTKSALLRAGADVQLVSACGAKAGEGRLPRVAHAIGPRERHIYLSAGRFPTKFGSAAARVVAWWNVIRYLLTEVRSGEAVLVYHAPSLIGPLSLVRRFKRFHLVLEVNEIYSTVWSSFANLRMAEERFVRSADAYLFVSSIAARKFSGGKFYAISHGTYFLPPQASRRDGGEVVHAVYAGVVDSRRGAELAAKSAAFLPENFVIDILGFGTDEAIAALDAEIRRVNSTIGRQCVRFHGQKRGRELTDFLHSCDVGLSTHQYRGEELEGSQYCFPSKVSLYVTHGLPVVSERLQVLVDSKLARAATFYEQATPNLVADAIVKGALEGSRLEMRELVTELDKAFVEELAVVVKHGVTAV